MYGYVNIPNNQSYGWYDLEVLDNATGQWIGFDTAALHILPPTITDIDPDYANQGQTLSVTISGSSMNYEQYSSISSFKFSQSGNHTFSGTSTGWHDNELYGDVTVPSGQPGGWYDLEVWDWGSSQWIIKQNAFEVIQLDSMITPNNGLQGETLQVFISGNQSHFSQNSSCNLPNLELVHTQHFYRRIDVPNNVGNWTYNLSLIHI